MGEAIARVEQLRDCFDRAIEKLNSLPEAGLSNDGRPFLGEVAEALKSFAAWFSMLTLDDMSTTGSAWRVHVAVNGLDAIADWVGLNKSQQFAADIRAHVNELVEKSEALDAAVTAAFTEKRTPNELRLSKSRRVPQAKRDVIEDGIQSVATLAQHLGIRLQRIALMAGSTPENRTGGSRGRGGRRQKDPVLASELLEGWDAFESDGRRRKDDYLAERPEVRLLKSADAKDKMIAKLKRTLNSALALQNEHSKQSRKPPRRN
jgi:hypothetical protein